MKLLLPYINPSYVMGTEIWGSSWDMAQAPSIFMFVLKYFSYFYNPFFLGGTLYCGILVFCRSMIRNSKSF